MTFGLNYLKILYKFGINFYRIIELLSNFLINYI